MLLFAAAAQQALSGDDGGVITPPTPVQLLGISRVNPNWPTDSDATHHQESRDNFKAAALDIEDILNNLETLTLRILQRTVLPVTVNSDVETDLLVYAAPPRVMGTNRHLRARMWGQFLNNTGSDQTIRLRIYFGNTVVYDDITANISSSANPRAFVVEAIVAATSMTSQVMGGLVTIGSAAASTAGIGDLGATTVITSPISGSSSENGSLSQQFRITVTLSANSPSTLNLNTLFSSIDLV